MADTNYSQVIMPLFLLGIMVLSVVGLSYTPDQRQQGPSGASSVQEEFSYAGYNFQYVEQGGQQVLQASIDGRPVVFRSRPQSIERFDYPASFQDTAMNTSSLTVVAPSDASSGQAQYAANQLASDISRRTPITASSENVADPACSANTIIVQANQTESLLEEQGSSCYVTSTLDQSILLITDIISYTIYDII